MCYKEKQLFVLTKHKDNEELQQKEKDKGKEITEVAKNDAMRDCEHDDPIVSIDVSEHHNMLVTADKEGLIKVWNEMKTLVREIKFYDEVASVTFANSQHDLLVGHGGKLSLIASKDYLDLKNCQPKHSEL